MHGITRCPNCHSAFKVAHRQLTPAGGKVRCGKCKQTFLASDHWLVAQYDSTDPQLTTLNAELPEEKKTIHSGWLLGIFSFGIIGLLVQLAWHYPGRSSYYFPPLKQLFSITQHVLGITPTNMIDYRDLDLKHVAARMTEDTHTMQIDGIIENRSPTPQNNPTLLISLTTNDGMQHHKIIQHDQINWQKQPLTAGQITRFNFLINTPHLQVIDYSTSLCCQPKN